MKFRTRLMITFTTIIVLPLLLTAIAFFIIGGYLVNLEQGYKLQDIDYAVVSESFQGAARTVDEIYDSMVDQISADVSRLEDETYLKRLEESWPNTTAYYIIRKDGEIFHSNNPEAAKRLLPELPEFGKGSLDEDSGYYFRKNNKYVKQYDFYFQDGIPGTIFVVAKMNSLISQALLVDMFIAILCILVFTSWILYRVMNRHIIRQSLSEL